MGLGAGAIDGRLNAFRVGAEPFHWVRNVNGILVEDQDQVGFDFSAAAEAPHGTANFVDKVLLEQACGRELLAELVFDFVVDDFFAWTDKVGFGEESELDAVL